MKFKTIFIAIVILGLLGISIGLLMYNKPHKNYSKLSPDFKLEAKELFNQFESNEVEANQKFLDKIILVSGTVQDITYAKSGEVQIALFDPLNGVTCTFDSETVLLEKEIFEKINIGDEIQIKGRCDGMLSDVRLSKCSFP